MALQQTGAAHGINSHCTSWRSPGTADSHTTPTAPPAPTSGCTCRSSSTLSSPSATQPTTAFTWTFCFSKTCVCVCVCACARAWVRTCMRACVCLPTCVCLHEQASMRACMHASVGAGECIYMHVSTYMNMLARVCGIHYLQIVLQHKFIYSKCYVFKRILNICVYCYMYRQNEFIISNLLFWANLSDILMCFEISHLLICTALWAHITVVEVLHKILTLLLLLKPWHQRCTPSFACADRPFLIWHWSWGGWEVKGVGGLQIISIKQSMLEWCI